MFKDLDDAQPINQSEKYGSKSFCLVTCKAECPKLESFDFHTRITDDGLLQQG